MSDPQQPENRNIQSNRDYRETRVGGGVYVEGDAYFQGSSQSRSTPPRGVPFRGVANFVQNFPLRGKVAQAVSLIQQEIEIF